MDLVRIIQLEKGRKKGWGVPGLRRVFRVSCDNGTTWYTMQIEIARPKIQIINSSDHLWFDDIIRFIVFYSELPMEFFE